MQQDNSQYVISRSSDGDYYFVLTSHTGDVLMTSENFTSRESAETGIRAVRGIATAAKVVDAAE
jgi:uncharacterized protein YegP (UPF0339 family)